MNVLCGGANEHRNIEQDVMAERKRLHDVLEMLPAYIILLTPDHHVTFANRFFRQRFGESHGQRCYEYLFHRNEPCEVCESFQALQRDKPVEWEWIGPDNHNYYVYDFPFVDSDGSTLILEMGIDITGRKQAEAALLAAHDLLETRVAERTAELAESNAHLRAEIDERCKVESALRESEKRYRALAEELHKVDQHKNDFLAVLSHELRNPLAAIKTGLEILDFSMQGNAQAMQATATIKRQVGQLSHLVDDLLDLTRISQMKIRLQQTIIELNELVGQVVEDHQSIFTVNGLQVEYQPASTPLYVNADKVRLAQVVGNLLMNACKFTPEGGRARVSVEVEINQGRQEAVIRVTDNGVGMSPDTIALLFQPYVQAARTRDRSRGGLGLGLALVKGIVQLHGGSVSAHSDGYGAGSEFIVRLPTVACPDVCSAAVSPLVQAVAPCHGRRVLIIDDNTDFAICLKELLELKGHSVMTSNGGYHGIQMALETRPDVIICDIGLPDIDGYNLAKALRSHDDLKGVCLIALTGYALREDQEQTAQAGFDMYMAKPPDFETLDRVLATGAIKRKCS